jgi:arginyl-tRNA synthetase
MARNYPRFIFSHPFDTKSKERFIVHTLHPQMIAKVIYLEDGGHQIEPLESFVETTKEQMSQIAYRMYDWYTNIRMQEAKLSFDFYDRVSDIARKLASTHEFFDGVVTISMVFIPIMGAKLELKKDNWNLEMNFENDETFETAVQRLKAIYQEKYLAEPRWPF